jgi:hypothetical protein
MFLSRPSKTKGKLRRYTPRKRFPPNSDIKYSAYPSGLLTYIIHPCTSSLLASRCQLAPPTPSPLVHELTPLSVCCLCAPSVCVICVPGAPSPIRSALPSPSSATSRRRQLVPPASPDLRYMRFRRRFCFPHPPQTARVPPPLPWLHQFHDRADTSYCHQPRCQARPPLTKLSAELPLCPEGDLAPFFFIRPHPRRKLRFIKTIHIK